MKTPARLMLPLVFGLAWTFCLPATAGESGKQSAAGISPKPARDWVQLAKDAGAVKFAPVTAQR